MNDMCYAIEGNVVDRSSNKNGKGYCENVSPTLNTQDRHAVVYAIEGNGSRASHQGKAFSDSGVMYTLNTIEVHSVCFVPEQNNCTSYKEGEISATLCTKYHYGNGGDAAIVLEVK